MANLITPYLKYAGKYAIEQVPCPHFNQHVRKDVRCGVLHTTEGPSIESALGVFHHHYAPQFLVGSGRILQLVQVGTIGAALKKHNDLALVQIEVVSYSKTALWSPDEATLDALASLLAACWMEYEIPLTHPWKDGDWGPHRFVNDGFGTKPGWYAHADIPGETHWDCGNLRWDELLSAAKDKVSAFVPMNPQRQEKDAVKRLCPDGPVLLHKSV